MKSKSARRITRRDFLKIGGVTLAATLAACERKVWTLQPVVQPTLGAAAQPALDATLPAYAITAPRQPASGPADLILKNGKVYTVDQAFSMAQALAVKDGLIQAVGDDRTIAGMAGDKTEVIDLGGKAVTPGLIDGHVHFRSIGLMYTYYTGFVPPDVKDIPSMQRMLKDVIKSRKPGEWIVGYYIALTDKPVH